MNKMVRICAMSLVSGLLIFLGVVTFTHQSSAAFELAIALIFAGIFHWIFWPDYMETINE